MLNVEDFNVFMRGKQIIHNTSFQMNEGHIVGLTGLNCAGKST